LNTASGWEIKGDVVDAALALALAPSREEGEGEGRGMRCGGREDLNRDTLADTRIRG
jgi:hypothetical protein